MIVLPLDTDVLRDYLDPPREHHQLAENLVRLDQERLCEKCLIIRFAADVPQGHLRDRLDKPEICQRPRIGTFAPWDVSEWDAEFWASDEDEEIHFLELTLIIKNHKDRVADIGHLIVTCTRKETSLLSETGRSLIKHRLPCRSSEFGRWLQMETLKRCSPK